MKLKLLYLIYTVSIFLLLLYSYTQIDLGLPLTGHKIVRDTQIVFQSIGFFHRDISTLMYLGILSSLSFCYLGFLYYSFKNKISKRAVFSLILITTAILTLSYNAFSKDIFNYIFDSKILVHYHDNPYLKSALDYTGDPMLSFLEWIHRKYPYGPIWLGLTGPLYFLGQERLIPTFFLFKALMSVFFLGSSYMLYKISMIIYKKENLTPLVFFSLSPLIIIESLVSAHNDIVMIFFALVGVYLLYKSRIIFAFLFLLFSVLVKNPALSLFAPFALYIAPRLGRIMRNPEYFFRICILSLTAGLIYFLLDLGQNKVELQPWYLVWFIPFVALLKPNRYIYVGFFTISFMLLLKYTFYLYLGNWTLPATFDIYKLFTKGFVPAAIIAVTLLSSPYKRIMRRL